MGKKWSNENLPGALHYLTGNVIHRIPIFKDDSCCKGFLEVLDELLHSWPSKIIAYVLMPDHFHLILNPRDGNVQGFAAALKSLGAKKIVKIRGGEEFLLPKPDKDGSIHQVWQESFKAFPLWSGCMISQKIDYVHANPVKARLASSARDYRWSSFRAFYFRSTEPLPVDHDWWGPDNAEKLSKAQKELGWKTYRYRIKKTT